MDYLGDGEREAITLAAEVAASHLLMNDMNARKEATRRRLPVIGTLGVLRKAAQLDLIHLPSALALLQQTNFYVATDLVQSLLDEDARRSR